jgi:hypothetical protein
LFLPNPIIMKKLLFKFILFLSFLILSLVSQAQTKYTISGNIKDKKNGEDIIGATIYVKETSTGASTNAYGYFSITLPQGKYTVSISYLGYKTVVKEIDLTANQKINIEAEEDKVQLQEVVVNAETPDANVKNIQMSVNKLDIKDIKKIPAFLGEVDVIKSLLLLPGVSTVGEGSSGFNVRGGSIDQNLVLNDEAPVYNTSHLFGFFSIFNPDAVKDVKLYKGGIPAQYGGRLSSILDVRLKEGNNKRFALQGGIGLIFSRLTLEGPIVKDKGSYIFAFRRSYADLLARPALANNADFNDLRLYFYDYTAKANYNISKRDKVFISGYLGQDVFGAGRFGFDWGNQTLSARWNHLFNDKLFMNLTAFYSNYNYSIGAETSSSGDGFLWKSNIINYSVKPDFTYFVNDKLTLSFGTQSTLYDFVPGTISFTSGGKTNSRTLPSKYAVENAVYLSSEQKISPRISVTYGLRFSNFNYIGSGVKQTYEETIPRNNEKKLIKEETFGSGQIIQTYYQPEPRATFKYELNENSSIKSSYMRTAQYLHLISNTAASIPLDVWTPSTNNIKPQLADQFALGYFRNFGENNLFEASVEGYYKDYQNQIDYVDGADLLLNPNLEGSIIDGKGRAYGLEFYIKKNRGAFNGWISYTLARTERQVDGINRDNWYPTRFDKTHNLTLALNYDVQDKALFFNNRWSFSSNVTYQSGTPINLATNGFTYDGNYVPQNPSRSRNNYRIPDYFRIDVAATLHCKYKSTVDDNARGWQNFNKRFEWDLVFSVYNITARQNAFGIFPRSKEGIANEQNTNYQMTGVDKELIRFSLFGFAIPSITFNFKF